VAARKRRKSSGAQRARLEVYHHLFAAAAEEMGASLMRSAFSPNIKERRDFSCALFGADGEMVAQAAHLPVHLGSSPLSLAAVREDLELGPGDVALLNDPFRGGTHLPDVTLVTPVFLGKQGASPDFYCVSRAHHADIGGYHPGSMAPVPDVHGEGLRLPPVYLFRAGELNAELLRVILANVRVPEERRADLLAQASAGAVGAKRLEALAREHGVGELRKRGAELVDWTADLTAELLASLPKGRFQFEDRLELGGGECAYVRASLRRRGKRLEVDFRDSDDQVGAPVNTVRAVVVSAVLYALRLLLPEGTPTNTGVLRDVSILTRPGSVVDACYPAAVAAGNVETSQRLVDVLLGVLAQVLPGQMPAASAGTMSNLSFGSSSEGFAYYETLAGGAGGGPAGPGAHALHTHMTNTRNTPVEVLENELPVRVLSTSIRRGSGGAGTHPGGDGIVRRLRFLSPARVGWVADRQLQGPWGLAGGSAGEPGAAAWRPAGARRDRPLEGLTALDVEAGAELEVRTPGGGGYGSSS
jgi:N-methylhydantoinase B